MKKRTKTLILCISIFIVAAASGFGLWYLLRDKAPVGNGNVLGVAWYHENGTEFTITTADELFELAELSEHYDFKDQTIKLGADIVVNEGNAADWEKIMPQRRWEPITGFAGTFDGQGHTISGLYGLGHFYGVRGTQSVFYTTGMFADTKQDCVIKNFKLLNSYFSSDLNEGVGSISSYGGGTFDSIYTDAIIVSYKSNNGGIVGLLNKKATITNCWFDGEMRVEGNVGRFTGGIVGRVMASNGQYKIEHCLNTADISSTVTNRGMNTGGIAGNVQAQARITIEDSLTVGDISVDYSSAVGSFIGNIESSAAVIVKNTYVKSEAFTHVIYNANGTMTGAPVAHNEATLTGYDAYKWSELDFENYWAVVEDGTPILQDFADQVPSLEGIEKGYDTSWYKPGDGEYLIKTAEQLYGFAILSYSTDFAGKAIYLGNDIIVNEGDAKDWAENAPADRWIPISTYGYPFDGMFDGQGHTISGVYLNTCGDFGLFGETGSSSIVTNLKLENSYLEAFGSTIGSVVGRAAGTMQNVYSNAIVLGRAGNVGGLVGQVVKKKGLQMADCWFDGTVTNLGNKSDTKKIGGLIGAVRSNCAVTNCLNTGTVDASVFNFNQSKDKDNPVVVPIVGGLIGYVEKEIPLTIQDCLNAGPVLYNKAATAAYGSAIGYIDGDVTAYNLYATEESCTNHPLKQSLTGQVCPIKTADLTGYKAYQWTLLDFEKHWVVNKSGTPILKVFATEAPSLSGVKKEVDISWYATDKKTFTLDSRQDLFGFRLMSYNTDFAEKTVKLGKDITVNTGDAAQWATSAPAYQWTPIGSQKYSFKGTFDGGMHAINGLYVKTDTQFSGFFGVLTEGTEVKNLKIMNSYYESSADFLGSIVGAGNADLSNIYSNAILVSSANGAAGLVGRSTKDIKITNCWFDGSATITGTGMPNRRAGGIVACIYSGKTTLSHCLNTGSVSAPNYTGTNSETSKAVVPLIGGLAGQVSRDAEVTIDDSLNTGLVTCNPAATTGYSAIVGYSDGKVTLTDTFATKESCAYQARGKITGTVTTYEEADISGYGGYQWMNLNFDKYWAVVVNPTASTPILQSFASNVPSLAGIEKLIDTSWYDEQKTEYVLYDKSDLNGLAYLSNSINFEGKTIKLGADIVVNADMKNPTYKWDSIGSKNMAFAGTFDGCMHTISGLYVNTDVECVGLFARTDKTATVKNLILKDSYFESSKMNIGSIAGIGHGTFDTIKSEATVVGHNARVGGFIGMNSAKGTSLTNCWFAGTVTNKGNGNGLRGTGGLVGVSYTGSDLTIMNCLNTGTVDASAYEYNQKTEANPQVVVLAGGLVGWVRTDATLTLGASLNTGEIKVSSKSADAKNGYIGYGSVVGYVNGQVKNSGNFYTTAESSPKQMNNGKTGLVVVKKNDIIGLGGYQWDRLNLDFKNIWTLVKQDTPILQSFADKVIDIAKVAKLIDTSWYDGKAGSTYKLYDMADLYGFAELSRKHDFAGMTVKLAKDIEINEGKAADWATVAPEYVWTPIGSKAKPFAGTFDGCMHTISGLYLKTDVETSGLFARTNKEATVKNLILKNSYFESSAMNLGSIAGIGAGTFDTLKSEAIVVGHNARVGGLIGMNSSKGTKLNNCWFAGSVTNKGNGEGLRGTAGLVAVSYSNSDLTIENCLNTGTVDASAYAYNQSKVVGEIKVTVLAGGLVGWVRSDANLTLKDSVNIGEVKVRTEEPNAATNGFGSVIGYVDGQTKISGTYTTTESSPNQKNGSRAGITVFNKQDIMGLVGYQWERLDLDFKETWTPVEGDTPILQAFANKVIDVSKVEKFVDSTWYDGKAGSTYKLYDEADLYGFAKLSQKYDFEGMTVKLAKDMEINEGKAADWATTKPDYEWTPIGSKDNPFVGTFDGYNEETKEIYEISGIYLKSTQRYSGLFAAIGKGATISNLKLINSYFEVSVSDNTQADSGGLVGYSRGAVNTVYSDAIVVGADKQLGGLVGQMASGASMTNCWFAGRVTNTYVDKDPTLGDDVRTGGLVGTVTAASTDKAYITNCLNSGIINAPEATTSQVRVGGLVGHVGSKASLELSHSLNVGTVLYHKATDLFGSVIGASSNATTVTSTYATTESCAKQICGDVDGSATAYDKSEIADEVGYQWERLDLDFKQTWTLVEEDTPVLQSFSDKASNKLIDASKVKKEVDTEWYDDVAGSTYKLYDKGDLYGFAVLSQKYDFAGMTVKLANDIVVNKGKASDWATTKPDYEWTPIGSIDKPFAGTFDGYNEETKEIYEIRGIYLNSTKRFSGLFSVLGQGATISNLKLTNSYFEVAVADNNQADSGGIVGFSQGAVNTVYSDAIVVGADKKLGGLIGQMGSGASMTNCWFDGKVTNTFQPETTEDDVRTGGLVGTVTAGSSAKATITNCLNSGLVNASEATSSKARVGGLVGHVGSSNYLELSCSLNIGTVLYHDATGLYGAIVGAPSNGTNVSNCYAMQESCAAANVVKSNGTRIPRADMKGDNALEQTSLQVLFQQFKQDNTQYWTTVYGNAPVLQSFKSVVIDESWYEGSESGKTYVLYDKADLLGFAKISQNHNFAGQTVKLGNDIVVNTGNHEDWSATISPAYEWVPIGNSDYPFAGNFYGEGHTISGLYVSKDTAGVGLFARTDESAELKEFKLLNSYFEYTKDAATASSVGSVVGLGKGTFSTIYSDAIVYSTGGRVGGLIGSTGSSTTKFTMRNCWFEGEATSYKAGGNTALGGLVGCVDTKSTDISDCLNMGDVYASYNKSDSTPAYIGGLVGNMTGAARGSISRSLNTGEVTAYLSTAINVDSLVGKIGSVSKDKLYSLFNSTVGSPVDEDSIKGVQAKTTLSGFDFVTTWVVRENDTPVLKFENLNEYVLSDAADLNQFATLSQTNNFEGKTIKLSKDINVNNDVNHQWTPISTKSKPFAGTFDGQGHKISGIYISSTDTTDTGIGLFTSTSSGAVVKNLTLENCKFYREGNFVGSIVGWGTGTFSDIYVDENTEVQGTGRVGGLVGLARGSVTMSNCWFNGKVTSTGDDTSHRIVGGLVGYITNGSLKMSNCLNSGTIDATDYTFNDNASDPSKELYVRPLAGGLVGCVDGAKVAEIYSCLNVGEVKVHDTATTGFGPILGAINQSVSEFDHLTIQSTYTVTCDDKSGITGPIPCSADAIKTNAQAEMPELDWAKQWESVEGAFPKVRFSKSGFIAGE